MAAASSSSFLPFSGRTTNNNNNNNNNNENSRPKTPKSPGRSRFSKALPVPPAALEKLLPSLSTSVPSSSKFVDPTPSLPPLPPASSPFLSSPNYSYIPTTSLPSSPTPPQPPVKSPARAMPGTIFSSSSAPPQPPPKQLPLPPLQQQQQQQQPLMLHQSLVTGSTTTLSSVAPGHTIRRRPVASTISVASSRSEQSVSSGSGPMPAASSPPLSLPVKGPVSSAPQLPDLPSFTSFNSLGSLPSIPSSSQLPELPPVPEFDTKSETQSQTKTVRAPSPAPEGPSSRAASISSILSAYSEDSSVPAGLSSSTSEGTVSTNNSSYMAVSSPFRSQPGEKDKQILLGVGHTSSDLKQEEILTPLSYLLDDEYGEEEGEDLLNGDRRKSKGDISHQAQKSLPYQQHDSHRVQHPLNGVSAESSKNHISNNNSLANNHTDLPVAPSPPSKEDSTVLPPRTTSLRHPPSDVLAKAVPEPTPAMTASSTTITSANTIAPLPPSATPLSPELWKRRSEKADTNLSVSELKLAPAAAAQAPAAILQTTQQAPPATPSKGGYLTNKQPLPPPQSPLPPPPSRSGVDQLQLPKSPLVGGTAGPASSLSPAASPRIGLPGRDIRPSRHASPAVTPIVPDAASSMGESLSKVEAKVESTLKRKVSFPPPPPPAKEVPSAQSPVVSKPQPPLPLPFQRLPTPDYDDDERDKHLANSGTITSSDAKSIAPSANGTTKSSSSTATVVNVPVSPEASPAASPSSILPPPPPAPFSKENAAPIDTPRPTPPPQLSTGLVGRNIRPVVANAPKTAPEEAPQQPPKHSQQPQEQFAPRTSSRKESISTPTGPSWRKEQTPSPRVRPTDEADTAGGDTDSQVTVTATTKVSPAEQISTRLSSAEDGQGSSARASVNSADAPLAPGMPPAFPSNYLSEPITPDTVFSAPPPTKIQFGCLQQHRDMFRDRNANYPLSCQACQTHERSMRWRCKWCYLRICTDCRDTLYNHAGRDLTHLMAYLERGKGHEQETRIGKDAAMRDTVSEGEMRPHISSVSPMAELPVIQET